MSAQQSASTVHSIQAILGLEMFPNVSTFFVGSLTVWAYPLRPSLQVPLRHVPSTSQYTQERCSCAPGRYASNGKYVTPQISTSEYVQIFSISYLNRFPPYRLPHPPPLHTHFQRVQEFCCAPHNRYTLVLPIKIRHMHIV